MSACLNLTKWETCECEFVNSLENQAAIDPETFNWVHVTCATLILDIRPIDWGYCNNLDTHALIGFPFRPHQLERAIGS